MAYVNYKNSPSEETPLTGGATGNLNVMQENGTSHGSDTKLGYSQAFLNEHLVNVSNEVDEDYSVNFLNGENLFNKNGFSQFNGFVSKSGAQLIVDASSSDRTIYVPCKPNTSYTISKIASNPFYICTATNVVNNTPVSNAENLGNVATTYTITSGANDKYLCLTYYNQNSTQTQQAILNSIMINEGSTALPYEPYITPAIYVNNKEIYRKGELLFNGNQLLSMSSTTLTLSKNLTDYSLIEIYYTKYSGSDSILSSLKIVPINNGYISPQIMFKATSNIIQQFWCLLKITTNAITLNDIGYVNYKISDNSVEAANNTGSFSIVKIIGYK